MSATPATPHDVPTENLTRAVLLGHIPYLLFLLVLEGGFIAMFALNVSDIRAGIDQLVFIVAFLGAIGVVSLLVGGEFVKYARRWDTLRRFGHLILRLPRAPLELGTHPEVELVVERELTNLSRFQVTLRQVRLHRETRGSGKKRRTVTIRKIEFEQGQELSVEAVGPGRNLPFSFELPAPELVDAFEYLGRAERRWELRLVSKDPKASLDVTFLLPVRPPSPAVRVSAA
jgi:hypothetical protein